MNKEFYMITKRLIGKKIYLDESVILNESIEDIYTKYYSDIKRDVFDKLISLDPTYNPERDKLGDYGQWILRINKKKPFKKEELDRLSEVLFDFNDRKRYINPPEMRDINRYKTLDEIRTVLDNIELTANQKAKQARKAKQHSDLGEDAEFIGENDKWEIWSPKTYAASCKLGSGSRWCTASTADSGWFERYTSRGKLYVFLPKGEDKTQKYQAHISTGEKEINTFLDINDRPTIDFLSFAHNEKLLPVLKDSVLKDIKEVNDLENMERISKGEPFVYVSGKILDSLTPLIKTIIFNKDHKETLLKAFAFKGCSSLETVYLHESILEIGVGAFTGCGDKAKIYTTKREKPIKVYPKDMEYLRGKMFAVSKEKMIYKE
jgi:hypothetical protein